MFTGSRAGSRVREMHGAGCMLRRRSHADTSHMSAHLYVTPNSAHDAAAATRLSASAIPWGPCSAVSTAMGSRPAAPPTTAAAAALPDSTRPASCAIRQRVTQVRGCCFVYHAEAQAWGISWPSQLSDLALQQLSNAAIASHSCCRKDSLYTATALLPLTADARDQRTSPVASIPMPPKPSPCPLRTSLRNAPPTAPG